MTGDNTLINSHGVNRRDFMKLCAALAATMGLSSKAAAEMAESVSRPQRPPVVWIGAQECTGCTESLLRATHPTVENLVLETISLEYHEVLSAAFGHQVEENKHNALEKYKGQYVLVVDGSIPLKDNGIYCMVAGEPIVDHIRKAAEGAAAIIAIGSCAAWGGVAAAGVNPTGAVGLQEVLPGKTIINIPGCPPNPHNFLATVAHIITWGKPPKLDAKNRPTFAYGRLIHEHCERRPHFDAGRFAKEFGDEGHREGWCLYHLGCKGPETWGNCSTLQFCDVGGVWPVAIGPHSLQEVLPGKTIINIPGCPPNPHNFLATVAHIITWGKPPKLDAKNRPTFAYGRLIHEHCERRPHFDAGRFAKEFGDEGHREGWCLYHLGCKGPETWGNCSTLQFCDVGGVWPVAIGHPCYGCNEEGVGFHKGIHQLAHVENQTPRSEKPDVNMKEGGNISAGAIGLLGGVVGLVAGVSVMAVRELGRQQKKDNADSRGE